MPVSYKQNFEFERGYNYEILTASIYGAFLCAIETRKEENSLTQAKLATLTDKDKSSVSKLLAGPGNWTTRTISDLCVALDLGFEFCLVDKLLPYRVFTATGVETANPTVSTNTLYEGERGEVTAVAGMFKSTGEAAFLPGVSFTTQSFDRLSNLGIDAVTVVRS